jgi:hypothetical protein
LRAIHRLRIRGVPQDPGVHYLVSDKRGNCVSIEFIGGELVYHTGETLPAKALANTPYAEDVSYWEQGAPPSLDPARSVYRFIFAADRVKAYDPDTSGPAVDYAFNILANLDWFVPTQWSIVYDTQNLRIYFRTLENEQVRYVDLSSFDFSCIMPVKVLDVNADLSGDVSNDFIDYTYEINRDLIIKTSPDMPDEVIDIFSHYPETTFCTAVDCFIATAAYGSMMEPHVKVLREFRDRFLLDNRPGTIFVHLYNTSSPPFADFIARHDTLRAIVRLGLLPIVGVGWISLEIGPLPTMIFMLALMLLISTATVIIFKKMRLRLH